MYIKHFKKHLRNKMTKRIVSFLIILCVLSCGSASAADTIIEDNFNNVSIDTDIWRNLAADDPIGGDCPSRCPVEQNGHLEIYNDGVAGEGTGLRTRINIPVDAHFEAQVSFNASDCAEESSLQLSVHNFNTDYDHAVQYAMIRNAVLAEGRRQWMVMKSSGVGDEEPVIEASESTVDESGVFYITYDAGTIHLSHTGYGAANALKTVDISGWTDCAQVWLALTAWSDGTVLTGEGSYFDDYYLTISDESDGVCTPDEADLLHPVALGLRYTYSRTDGDGVTEWTVGREFVDRMTVDSVEYYLLSSWNYDNEGESELIDYVRSTNDTVYSYNPSGGENIEFQVGSVGTTWTIDVDSSNGYSQKVIEIAAIEEVTVPYGTFCAYKYRNYRTNPSGDLSPPWYEWLVPGVGIVKELDYWPNEGQNAPLIMELVGMDLDVDMPPSEQIEAILEFIEVTVDDGELVGAGPGKSANNRLNALINMVQEAQELIEDDFYEEAYLQLEDAYKKCDGQSPPPDFVQGDAAAELADMILSLMEAL